MNTPIASSESLQIGSVDFVSPDEIKVLLDLDAPSDVALNSGCHVHFHGSIAMS